MLIVSSRAPSVVGLLRTDRHADREHGHNDDQPEQRSAVVQTLAGSLLRSLTVGVEECFWRQSAVGADPLPPLIGGAWELASRAWRDGSLRDSWIWKFVAAHALPIVGLRQEDHKAQCGKTASPVVSPAAGDDVMVVELGGFSFMFVGGRFVGFLASDGRTVHLELEPRFEVQLKRTGRLPEMLVAA